MRGPLKKNEATAGGQHSPQTNASKQNSGSTANRGAFAIAFSRCGASRPVAICTCLVRKVFRFEAETIITLFVIVVNG